MDNRRAVGALLLGLALAACTRSGTWVDDPGNYERAFGQAPPKELQIRHSWYWRSPHFTREEAYYFQFGRHDQVMRGFIAANGLQPLANATSLILSDHSCFSRPAWFAPKPMGAYKAWVMPPNISQGLILEDPTTGDFFMAACQL